MPLAGLSSTTGRVWAGYHTTTSMDTGSRDPLMYLEQRSSLPPGDTHVLMDSRCDSMYFRGEGHDGVGTFTVVGACYA
jgi:hypothetical protein